MFNLLKIGINIETVFLIIFKKNYSRCNKLSTMKIIKNERLFPTIHIKDFYYVHQFF